MAGISNVNPYIVINMKLTKSKKKKGKYNGSITQAILKPAF